jgi:hypothetical protein
MLLLHIWPPLGSLACNVGKNLRNLLNKCILSVLGLAMLMPFLLVLPAVASQSAPVECKLARLARYRIWSGGQSVVLASLVLMFPQSSKMVTSKLSPELANLHGVLDIAYIMDEAYDTYTGQIHFDLKSPLIQNDPPRATTLLAGNVPGHQGVRLVCQSFQKCHLIAPYRLS